MATLSDTVQEQLQQIIQQQQQLFNKQLELQQQFQHLQQQHKQQHLEPAASNVKTSADECKTRTLKRADSMPDSQNTELRSNLNQTAENHQNCQPDLQQQNNLQQQPFPQQSPNCCSYFMRLRHMGEHPEGMYTTYSPEWYIGNLGFRASLWPDNYGKSYCAALHLSYFSMDTTHPFPKSTIQCKVTLMDPLGRQPDCLLAERKAVFDGSREIVNEWARGCVMVRIKMKDMKERGMCNDYTLLIRYDVTISV